MLDDQGNEGFDLLRKDLVADTNGRIRIFTNGAEWSRDSSRVLATEHVERELSREIVAAFYDVYNVLGFGFLESIYARSLEIAMRRRGLHVEGEVACEIYFTGVGVGVHRADMIVERRTVIEVKGSAALAEMHKRQLLNYVRAFDLELGILLHFGPKPSFHRVLSARKREHTTTDSGNSCNSD